MFIYLNNNFIVNQKYKYIIPIICIYNLEGGSLFIEVKYMPSTFIKLHVKCIRVKFYHYFSTLSRAPKGLKFEQ